MNLTKYVVELDSAYRSRRKEWETMQNRIDAIKEELADINKSSGERSQLRTAADVEELQNELNEIKQNLEALQESAYEEFNEIQARFDVEIRDFMTVKPEDVDQAGALLINSGILTDSDLCDLVRPYSENGTMLKMIESEAQKRDTSVALSLTTYLKAFRSTTERDEIFKGAALTVYRALNPGRGLADPNATYWDEERFQETRDEIAKLEHLDLDAMSDFIGQ